MNMISKMTLFAFLLIFTTVCQAGNGIIPPPSGHPGETRPELPDYLPEKPGRGLTLPQPPVQAEPPAGEISFELKGLIFEGNTIFSDEELGKIAESFLGKPVTLADLEELRFCLTNFHINHGYINSGAILKPDQNVDAGIVIYLIREGRLDEVKVTGNGRLQPGYIRKRINPKPDQAFNIKKLQERFQLLLEDPMIDQMDGRIHPGVSPGEAVLDLDVTRSRSYELSLTTDNHSSPSTGAERITAAGSVWNLTGFGDRLDASFAHSRGADEISAGFSIPLNARNTRISLYYNRDENSVIEEPLDAIDIESESETAELNLTHPLIHNLRRKLELGITLAARESRTRLLNMPFSFTKGDVDGRSQVTALRLIQSYTDRTLYTALALRSTLSLGIDLFGPTIHAEDRPDGQFLAWLGQIQYAQRIGERFGQIILRGDIQIANDNLLSLEQFAVGGIRTVRGYRENELVRDNGYVLSAEWRYPLWKQTGKSPEDILQLAVFTDFGSSWNEGESSEDENLHSAGLGLLWTPNQHINAELYMAHDIEEAADKDDWNLQDDGIHFRVSYNIF
ncbi:MAG: ShlB/FhaC/HecB family hemolysin secretion/activation protein [Desulfococcaceae bacterium]